MSTILLGDLHGVVEDAYYRLDILADERVMRPGDTIIWLGDVGLIYEYASMRLFRAFERLGEEYEVRHVVLRGNHDNRYCRDIMSDAYGLGSYSRDERYGGEAYVLDAYPHTTFLSDTGGTYTFSDKKVLAIPGAWSIDKEYRLRYGYPWEREEMLTLNEMNAILDLTESESFDAVISHTCPLSWFSEMSGLLFSGKVDTDSRMEQFMDSVLERVDADEWWFGHFHGDKDISDIGHLLYWGYGVLGEGAVRPLLT